MNIDGIKVIDDFISPQVQEFVKNQLVATGMPWVFLDDVTYGATSTDIETRAGFQHIPFTDGTITSTAYWFLYPILLEACSKNNIVVKQLLRIRVGLYVNANSEKPNHRHIDQHEPHLVGLYYVDDCDGDTVFYANDVSDEEILRCTPKRGRMILFNGSIYHASTPPVTKQYRITVNFNFLCEE
jgi:hypothetical protein